jgi:hypothetical protein
MTTYAAMLFPSDRPIAPYRGRIAALALGLVALTCGHYAFEVAQGGHIWKTGDWLINYSGGLVRRGLIGEALYRLSASGPMLLWLTWALQAATVTAVAILALQLFYSVPRTLPWLLFLFSPAFLFLFPIYAPTGGFRKEILLFLSFALLMRGLAKETLDIRYAVAALIVFALGVAAHEVAAFFVIFFLGALVPDWRRPADDPVRLCFALIFGLLAASGLALALLAPGGASTADAVCASLVAKGLNEAICAGAINWLRLGSDTGATAVAAMWPQGMLAYAVLLALALVPFALTDWLKTRAVLLVLAALATLPLYAVAIDWGRWNHIFVVMATLLLFRDSLARPVRMRAVPPLAVLAYATLWSLPHFGAMRPGLGVVEFLIRAGARILG